MKTTIEYEVGDRVKLPFGETGTIKRIQPLLWATRYYVRIRKSNGFNKTINYLIMFVILKNNV